MESETVEKPQPLADGLHKGLSRADYDAIPAANYSRLKLFARSAAHARQAIMHPEPPTEAMELGSAVHHAVLEPSIFAAQYVVAPKFDRRTTKGKEGAAAFEAENRGKSILDPDQMAQCLGMSQAVWAHPLCKELLTEVGVSELAALWTDSSGIRCKALLDRVFKFGGWSMVVDLKTTDNAEPWAFGNSVAKYAYHEQAAFYLDGLNQLSPGRRRWLWIAVEKEPPYAISIFEPTAEMLEKGRAMVREHLAAYAQCRETNVWPGYPVEIQPLELPRWAAKGNGEV